MRGSFGFFWLGFVCLEFGGFVFWLGVSLFGCVCVCKTLHLPYIFTSI